ncbi:cytochrome P450 [Natrialba sp. INN-245]|uniref:cytochrome P450 n=1 Tax=Natrialba sp. INN-245 TaxID=2690967 RepID=UPI0013117C46|nr:cytochrome P450 [Natrialba sp. INN-245]MWV40362.1 cytochrome P450 [Natrialba sp. INN-245]
MASGSSATDGTGQGIDAGDGNESDRPIEEYPLAPAPAGYPIVGNAFQVVNDPFGFYDVVSAHGDVVRYSIVGNTFTALLHPDHVERVLVSEHERFERYLFADLGLDIGAEGLVMSDGEQWRRQRGVMQPVFTTDRVQSYAETMATYADRAANRWDDGEVIAANREFSRLTLRILAEALFDLEVDPTSDDEAVVRAARAINERADARRLSTFLPEWVPSLADRRFERTMDEYRRRVDELIGQRRATGSDGDDLLSVLVRAGGSEGGALSEAEIRDNLVTLLFAGHETSSVALTYTFLLLAQHDDVVDELRAELESVVGDDRPSAEHVRDLEYIDAVITEAMRRYPPVYMLFRRALEDVVIGGYRIPEGTILTLPQFRIHRDERFYDAPEEFRPERWTDEAEDDRPEYAYFPFGGGPRHCIGMRFATLEMTLIVATLLRRFDLELLSDPDPKISPTTTFGPAEDVRIRLHRR